MWVLELCSHQESTGAKVYSEELNASKERKRGIEAPHSHISFMCFYKIKLLLNPYKEI